ncbi:hypothetical protein AYI69_g4854 [Smittium culicis]|uniref:RRM domain-containing protein n=1 Tax=Smittium culicis TaxID=133412 RepID=A0A1R1YA54_9FUNG|nr:hypothetical protein AYI69_g4854 [Smittium culicis]
METINALETNDPRGVSIFAVSRDPKIYSDKRAIWVENFDRTVHEKELRDIFGQVGPIESLTMGVDKFNRSLCKAEIVYKNSGIAKDAVQFISGEVYTNKIGFRLDVTYSSLEKYNELVDYKYKSSLPKHNDVTINQRLGL